MARAHENRFGFFYKKLRPHDVNNSPSGSCRNIIVEEPGDKAFLPRN